jgi:pantetheine-phosphate adenylyltransferase
MRKALYAGSFDPITLGHLDVLRQACDVFDVVHVAVGQNPKKSGLFTPEERMALILTSMGGEIDSSKVEVGCFQGSAAKYARSIDATHLIRGLRQVSDFNDEFVYNGAMQQIAPDLPMAYFICRSEFLHVSSSTARELASLNEDVSWLVPPRVERGLQMKFQTYA